jgi:hypothetical protein
VEITIMSEQEKTMYRACPFCGGKNTGYWIVGIEEVEWFTTIERTSDGFTLNACSELNRHRNLPGRA